MNLEVQGFWSAFCKAADSWNFAVILAFSKGVDIIKVSCLLALLQKLKFMSSRNETDIVTLKNKKIYNIHQVSIIAN